MNKSDLFGLFDEVKLIVAGLPLYRKSLITFGDIINMLIDRVQKGEISPVNYEKTIKFISYFVTSSPNVAKDFRLSYTYYGSSNVFKRSDFVRVEKGRYITKPMSKSWKLLLAELKNLLSPGHQFTITSAYRSPAYQFYIMCSNGARNDIDLQEVFRTVAPPFHSKHGTIPPAIDILEFFDSQKPNEVRSRKDWKIFVKTAKKYGFAESYPDGDPVNGGAGEPWEFVFIG